MMRLEDHFTVITVNTPMDGSRYIARMDRRQGKTLLLTAVALFFKSKGLSVAVISPSERSFAPFATLGCQGAEGIATADVLLIDNLEHIDHLRILNIPVRPLTVCTMDL